MAQPSVLPPSQRSQPSRKGKKAWRKNVDIAELQEGLEQAREEIIQGGIVSELPSTALFTTDITPNTKIQDKYNKKHKSLKADEILAQRSAIPAVSSRKRLSESRTTDGIIEKRRKKDGVSYAEYEKLRKVAYGGDTQHKDIVQADVDADHDPWEVKGPVQKEERYDYLEEKKPVKAPATLKHKPISLAVDRREIKAVRTPAAEKSYNPTFEDWSQRLDREGAKAVELEMKRLDEEAKNQERLERIAKAQQEEEKGKEWESEWDSEWEGIGSESEQTPEWLKKKRPERKTQAERNKIQRRKEAESRKKWEEKEKQRAAQAKQIKALKKQVDEEDKLRAEKIKARTIEPAEESSDDAREVVLRKKRFGKNPILDAPLEVMLVEDLPDSLRRLKPEGNLLNDRYRGLLLQGKVESRKAMVHKQAKRTTTEKWSYKDWKLK